MRNNKGFTLSELLSVVVILGILAVVVIPVVNNVIIGARTSANARSVEGHVRNIEMLIMSEGFTKETGDLTAYDMTDALLPSELLEKLPENDMIFCSKYTISSGTVISADDCVSNVANWHKKYGYTNTTGAKVTGTNEVSDTLSYCTIKGVTSLKECLLRSDSMDTLSNALSKINTRTSSVNFTQMATDVTTSGLYVADDDYTVDADTKTYYYRGVVDNNWVKFGNFLWRVVRINGDGSIRLIYQGLATASSHTGNDAAIKNKNNGATSSYGVVATYTKTTTDISGLTSDTITTSYKNNDFGNTYVGYMYNPNRTYAVYPNRTPSNTSGKTLSSFPTHTNTKETTQYYFFANFEPSTDCDQSTTNDTGACMLKCRKLGEAGADGVDCIKSTWTAIRGNGANYNATGVGSTSTLYTFTGAYPYTCWGYATATTKNNSDGTTSVYISCPVVSEILGTVKDSTTKAVVKYHGLFSSTAAIANTNTKDSNAKVELDYWYANNIANKKDSNNISLENYIADEIFCNDRTSGITTLPLNNQNNYTYYAYTRLTSGTRTPRFKCTLNNGNPNPNDSFTLKTSGASSTVTPNDKLTNLGNKKLTYPVGLLTLDELIAAGAKSGSSSKNTSFYLYTGTSYWTMTPQYIGAANGYAYGGIMYSTGYMNMAAVNTAYNLRPVINLKAGIKYTGGTGTETDPYTVGL